MKIMNEKSMAIIGTCIIHLANALEITQKELLQDLSGKYFDEEDAGDIATWLAGLYPQGVKA